MEESVGYKLSFKQHRVGGENPIHLNLPFCEYSYVQNIRLSRKGRTGQLETSIRNLNGLDVTANSLTIYCAYTEHKLEAYSFDTLIYTAPDNFDTPRTDVGLRRVATTRHGCTHGVPVTRS